MRKLIVLAVALFAVALVPNPAGAAKKPPTPKTAAALASAVTAAGFECTNFKPGDRDQQLPSEDLPQGDHGKCTIRGHRSDLTVFENKKDLQAVFEAIPTQGCSLTKALRTTTFRYVRGPNWSIESKSATTGRKLAKALGAKIYTYECEI